MPDEPWAALPADIGSEQYPALCCAIGGGLSSRMITARVQSPKTQKGLAPSNARLSARVKPVLQLGRGMACNAMHLVDTWLLHRSVMQVRRNERPLVLVSQSPRRRHCLPKMHPQAGALGNVQPIKNGLVSSVALHPRCAVDALRRPGWLLEDDLIARGRDSLGLARPRPPLRRSCS